MANGRRGVANAVVSILNAAPSSVAGAFRSDARVGRLVRPVLNRLMPAQATAIVVRSGPGKGLRLMIDPATEKFYWTGTHEIPVQLRLTDMLRRGMTFWDVGAHAGFFTLLASRLVGPEGRVHAFEPMRENRSRLRASIELNGSENVTVHDVAVADRAGERILYASAASVTWSLVASEPGQGGLEVRCETLDRLARSLGPPDAIKIDVERAELDVLRGGLGLLERHRPVVFLEATNAEVAAEARELFPFSTFDRLSPTHWMLR